MVDFRGGEPGADKVGRSGPRHGEHAPLDAGFTELLVHLGHGVVVVRVPGRVFDGAYQVTGRRRHFPGEGLDASSLCHKLVGSGLIRVWGGAQRYRENGIFAHGGFIVKCMVQF